MSRTTLRYWLIVFLPVLCSVAVIVALVWKPWAGQPAGFPRNSKPGEVHTLRFGNPSVEMRFRWIPPGEFDMGSDTDRADEKPMHRVKLTKGLWITETEVTQAQWNAVGLTLRDVKDPKNPSSFRGDDLPVDSVSWDDCQEFCQKFSQLTGHRVRLPTEAEWEYACRAGTTTEYYTGDGDEAFRKAGWDNAKKDYKTKPVGQLAPNAWNLRDMHGNLWEWCSDWYGDYPTHAQTDPVGPPTGKERVLRGGSWHDPATRCRSSSRSSFEPALRSGDIGFRVVLERN